MPFSTRAFEAEWTPLSTITVDGHQVRVMHNELHATGPTVLMMHGLEEVWQVWLPMAARMKDDYRLLLVDLPWRAHNDYAWSESLSPSAWLGAVMRTLSMPLDAIIGHSFGSNTTLEYLSRPDARPVGAAVLTSPVYRADPAEITWDLLDSSVKNFRRIIEAGLLVRGEGRTFDPDVLDSMVTMIVNRVGPNGFVNLFRLFGHSPFIDVAAIDVPTMVIGGRNDPTATATGARALAERLTHGSVELLEEFDHFCQVVQVDEVTEIAVNHLTRHLALTGSVR